jgi:crotonobetainyl-CoA:carnitine CoA-transferase CaiB-like acyl-CoA transferase
VTFEFNNGEPANVDMSLIDGATFTQGASGQQVTLMGNWGLLVIIHGADEHTAYSGPTDIKPGYAVLLELRQTEDFEGTVQWGFGLAKAACYRAFFLTSPARVVIDIQNS